MQHQLLNGKNGIIFGVIDERSIAWAVARQCVAEGAHIVLTNTESAIQLGTVKDLAEEIGAPLIPCDATSVDELENLFRQSIQYFGGSIDFMLHSIAMSFNLRRKRDYDDVNYSYFTKTLDVSALSFHKMLQVAKKMDALNEYASVVALSYLAAHSYIDGYNDMSEAKALLEAVARNFGGVYGQARHVRINTISQSPLLTRAGSGFDGFRYFCDFTDHMSPLGNAKVEDCAKLCVMLFSDYTRFVTMQNIYNDGGFSATAMTSRFIDYFRESSYSQLPEEQKL